jgi:hypothetical protein
VLKPLFGAYMLCASHVLLSQSVHTLIGSRAHGLGYASSCLYDEWAVFNNIAGLAKTDQLTAGFTYEVYPSLSAFNRMAVVVASPVKSGVAGLGVYRLGDDLYNEQVLTAGYSNTFGLASLGVTIRYIQYRADGFGTKGLFSMGFGGIAHLTSKLSAGAHIINLTQPEISSSEKERLPTVLLAGLVFAPSGKVLVTTEVEKDMEYTLTWKTGIEYTPLKKFSARTGFNLHPEAGFVGFGFKPARLILDYAFHYQPAVGSRHQATVVYHFKRKNQ